MEKWVEGKYTVEQGFSLFFAIFDDFSKWSVLKAVQELENSSNMAKNEEKSCSI